jgi:hypothetical protein
MNRTDLIELLEKEGIPSSWYSLYGELLPDRIVLYENYDKWEVFFFDERGGRHLLRICGSEASACDFIHQQLAEEMLASKSVLFSRSPVVLPQTLESSNNMGILETATHVWLDSIIIEQKGAVPEDVVGIIFELEKMDYNRYKIRFWGSKQVCVLNGLAHFSVDFVPYHDWLQIYSDKDEAGFEEECSEIICRCTNYEGNASYRELFVGKKLYIGFRGRIHIVLNT